MKYHIKKASPPRPFRSLKAASSKVDRGWLAALRSMLSRKGCYDAFARRREARLRRLLTYALDIISPLPPCPRIHPRPSYKPAFLTIDPSPLLLTLPASPVLLTLGAAPTVIAGLLEPTTLVKHTAEAVVATGTSNLLPIVVAAITTALLLAKATNDDPGDLPVVGEFQYAYNGDYPDAGAGGESVIYSYAELLGTGLEAFADTGPSPPDEDIIMHSDLGFMPASRVSPSFMAIFLASVVQLFSSLSLDGLLDASSSLFSVISSYAGFALGLVFDAADTFFAFTRNIENTLSMWRTYTDLALALQINPTTVNTIRSSLMRLLAYLASFDHGNQGADGVDDDSDPFDGPGLTASMWAPGPDEPLPAAANVIEPVHIILDADVECRADEDDDDWPNAGGSGASMWAPQPTKDDDDDWPSAGGSGASIWATQPGDDDDDWPSAGDSGTSMWAPQPGEEASTTSSRPQPVHIFI
ncbi:hypothetical protein HGRIS_004565 [Hohenbuehelia grisea]|uniref:PH domain-containing protein n=1 Tax=Hohenbuehelia grisea TaxID=104357 RepID=A0ABR3JDY0_9AGAR